MGLRASALKTMGRLARATLSEDSVASLRRWHTLHFTKSRMVSHQAAPARRVDRLLGRKPRLFHFEIHITDHCNLNCRGCAHFSNISPQWFADPEQYERDMRRMADLFEVEQIYVMGGEPLLHPEVSRFVELTRVAFPRTRIYLMTNGVLVTRMPPEFWQTLARTRTVLLCDSYPIGLPVDEIDALGRQHGATVEWTEPRDEFFRVPIDPRGGRDATYAYRRCQDYNNCPIVRNGRLYPCAPIAYAEVLADRFDLDGLAAGEENSVDIFEADGWEALEFMLKPVPWCEHCDFDNVTFQAWGRSRRTLDEWVDVAPRPSERASVVADDGL